MNAPEFSKNDKSILLVVSVYIFLIFQINFQINYCTSKVEMNVSVLIILFQRKLSGEANPMKQPGVEFEFEDDGMDDILANISFPQLPAIIAEKIQSHIEYMKKYLYYDGRVILLKRAKKSGIPMQGCSFSSLNFEALYNEHVNMGPLIKTKYKPNVDYSQMSNEMEMFEGKRDSYLLKLNESKIFVEVYVNTNLIRYDF